MVNLVNMDATQIEAVAAAAKLISTVGIKLFQGWEFKFSEPTDNTQME